MILLFPPKKRLIAVAIYIPLLWGAGVAESFARIVDYSNMPVVIWAKPKQEGQNSPITGYEHAEMKPGVPNFQAPSANTCNRALIFREISGNIQRRNVIRLDLHEQTSHIGDGESRDRETLEVASPLPSSYVPFLRLTSSEKDAYVEDAEDVRGSMSEAIPTPPTPVPAMTDDNADFGKYLTYLENHAQITHKVRDVSERSLLIVRDEHGQTVADAEVAIVSPHGDAMWARTDTAGKVWVHLNAFDVEKKAFVMWFMCEKMGMKRTLYWSVIGKVLLKLYYHKIRNPLWLNWTWCFWWILRDQWAMK